MTNVRWQVWGVPKLFVLDIFTEDHWLTELLNEWMNDKDVFKTAAAWPGLWNTLVPTEDQRVARKKQTYSENCNIFAEGGQSPHLCNREQ